MDPYCSETSLSALNSWITPTDQFYIRNHFSQVPQVDLASWRLSVEGDVNRPLSLSYNDLTSRPSKESPVILECAGNSRSKLTPPAEGLAFGHGAVGNAMWVGVPLTDLLDEAGVQDGATEMLAEGVDVGIEEEEGKPIRVNYQRSLPLAMTSASDVLVTYQMNGMPLTPAHGAPVRLIVPGWFGMASVKWLTRIEILSEPFKGFFQNRRYVFIEDGATNPSWNPVTTQRVKSLITHPQHGEVIVPGVYSISGKAWTGDGDVARVEISCDGGTTWRDANLGVEGTLGSWHSWDYRWNVTNSGHFILKARATDSNGATQTESIQWNFRGYANNSIHAIAVEVS